MTDSHRKPLPAGLVVVGVVVAAAVAVFATAGFGEAVLLVLAVGVLTAGYMARRYVRDALLYRDRTTARGADGDRTSRVEDESDLSNPIDTSATAPTSRDPESPPPGRASCPELVWKRADSFTNHQKSRLYVPTPSDIVGAAATPLGAGSGFGPPDPGLAARM